MNLEAPETTSTCPVRLGSDQPWIHAEVGLGVRSLLVQPIDADDGATWIPYEDVSRLDEVDRTESGHRQVVLDLRNGQQIDAVLDDLILDAFVSALAASRAQPPAAPVKPVEFDLGTAPADISGSPAAAAPFSVPAPSSTPTDVGSGGTASTAMFGASPDTAAAPADISGSPVGATTSPPGAPPPLTPFSPIDTVSAGGAAPLGTETGRNGMFGAETNSGAPTTAPAPEPTQKRALPRRALLLAALGLVVLLALIGGAVMLFSGDDSETANTGDTAEEPGPDGVAAESPTTVAAPAVPTTPDEVLAVEASGVSMASGPEGRSLYASFDVRSLADQPIVSYELLLDVAATGAASTSNQFPLRCTTEPLAAGDTRSGTYLSGGAEQNAAGFANCTIAGWPIDAADPQQLALADALDAGAGPQFTVELVSATLADGTALRN